MTLFLASTISQTIDICIDELKMRPANIEVLYVPTAGDYTTPRPALTDHDSYTCLIEKGFKVTPCELDQEDEKMIKEKIDKVKMVAVGGGNTYFLLYHMKRSGFSELVKDFVKRGGIYVGSSAGSCVCSPNIDYVKDQDDPKEAPELTDYTGLGLIDFEIYPHCIEPWYTANYSAKYLIESHKSDTKKIYLRDHQAILVKDHYYKIVSNIPTRD